MTARPDDLDVAIDSLRGYLSHLPAQRRPDHDTEPKETNADE